MGERPVGVDLFWLPLGAGGHFVRVNGRVYEYVVARSAHRPPLDLYHTALEVIVPEGRYVIENAWPIPDGNTASRGVTVEGPVWISRLGHFRPFRYEVRRWRDGVIADIQEAVASPQRLTDEEWQARSVLTHAGHVPVHVWGRDGLRVGEMWNSNSVISWVLTRAGINARAIKPPEGGRAPGWIPGVIEAEATTETTADLTGRR